MAPRNRKLRLRKNTVQDLTPVAASLVRGGATQGPGICGPTVQPCVPSRETNCEECYTYTTC